MSATVSRRDMKWLRESELAALTVAEAAGLLRIDERTVGRAIADGQIPSVRFGRRVLIPRLPLLALLEGNRPA